jgi:hypothetical protein
MINNINNVDTAVHQQMNIVRTSPSLVGMTAPPILSFKSVILKQKATLRVKKFKRSDNIIIVGDIDEHYVDIIEEDIDIPQNRNLNFFSQVPLKRKTKYLKNSYVIDYIQSPQIKKGLGTEAVKNLVEKALFDPRTEGRVVTYCAPVWKESSPAQFFYKLGFRFIEEEANEYIKDCIIKKVADLPPQKGMMYLPKNNINKLLRYGELF